MAPPSDPPSPASTRRIALVTGSSQGIGRAIALRLAADGLDVALNDIPARKAELEAFAEEIRGGGSKANGNVNGSAGEVVTRACVVPADVSDEVQVKEMIRSCVEQLGGIDVMVANAGIVLYKPFFDTTLDEWERVFSINVRGVMLCYKYAGMAMVEQGRGGRIVGACSISGKRGKPMQSAYCASKFAVRGLTQSVAQALGKHGITVNTYAPGATETPLLQSMDAMHAEITGDPAGSFLEGHEKAISVGYTGKPRDVASLVSYLASPESHFITGQSIICDGGTIFD